MLSMDLQALSKSRVEAGGPLNHTDGTVFVLHNCGGNILDFNVVRRSPDLCLDRPHAAHDPLNHVDVVHSLVDQAAATIQCPRSAPVATVVIGLGAIPFYVRIPLQQLAKLSALSGVMKASDGCGETVLGDGPQLDSCGFTGFNEPSCRFNRDVNWLFNEYMLSSFGGGDSEFGVESAGDAYGNRIDRFKQCLERLKGSNPELLCSLLAPVREDIEDTDQLRSCDATNRLAVHPVDGAAADDPIPDLHT